MPKVEEEQKVIEVVLQAEGVPKVIEVALNVEAGADGDGGCAECGGGTERADEGGGDADGDGGSAERAWKLCSR